MIPVAADSRHIPTGGRHMWADGCRSVQKVALDLPRDGDRHGDLHGGLHGAHGRLRHASGAKNVKTLELYQNCDPNQYS